MISEAEVTRAFAKHLPGVEPRINHRDIIVADLGNGYTLTADTNNTGRWEFHLWSKDDGVLNHKADKHWPSDDFEECLEHFLRCFRGLWESPLTLWGQILGLIETHPELEGATLYHDGGVSWEHTGPIIRGMQSTTGTGADTVEKALRDMLTWLEQHKSTQADLGDLINDTVAP